MSSTASMAKSSFLVSRIMFARTAAPFSGSGCRIVTPEADRDERPVETGVEIEPRCEPRPSAREPPAGQPRVEDFQLGFHGVTPAAGRAIRLLARPIERRLLVLS